MLIDLEFIPHPNPAYTLEQIGSDTIVHLDVDGERHSLLVARRVSAGIYQTHTLDSMLSAITRSEEDMSYPGCPYFHFGGLEHLRGQPRDSLDFGVRARAMMVSPPSYGVADDLAQVEHYAKQYWESPRTFILTYHPVTRQDDPGWRWHKNGTYIGTQNPRCEHIGDEPLIEKVISWAFIEIKPRTEKGNSPNNP